MVEQLDMFTTKHKAFQEIALDGTIEKQENRIYYFIKKYPKGISRRELAMIAGIEINAVCGRVNELLKKHLVKVYGFDKCKITGKTVELITANSAIQE